MIKIIFVCHGNICRSPVAEILFKEYVSKLGLESNFVINSAALSYEEEGNDIYPPMKNILLTNNHSFESHHAHKMTLKESEEADYIFYMDESNHYLLSRYYQNAITKCYKLRYFIDDSPIEDPWYSGRYQKVYEEIKEGVDSIIDNFKAKI